MNFDLYDSSKFKTVTHDFQDCEWPVFPLRKEPDVISDYIRRNGAWELDLIKRAINLIKPQTVFLDIGANIGTWSLTVGTRLKSQGVKVIAFEPQKHIYDQFCAGIFINNLSDVITVNKYGLGSPDQNNTELTLMKFPHNNGGASFKDHLNRGTNGSEVVTVKTLDSFNLKNISVIKMDVEGHEVHVLDGARKTIQENNNPPIFFECWNTENYKTQRDALFAKFNELGYNTITGIGGFENSDYIATKT